MVLSKPCALVYSSLLLFLLLLFFSEVAFARLSASSKSKEKTELDLLMDFGSDKVTRSFAGQVKLSKGYLSKKLTQDNYEDMELLKVSLFAFSQPSPILSTPEGRYGGVASPPPCKTKRGCL